MTASLTGVLAAVGGSFSLIAIVAIAFVWFRGSADKATIESQGRLLTSRKEEIEDLTRRVALVETENTHLKEAVAQVRGIDAIKADTTAILADTTAIRGKVLSP